MFNFTSDMLLESSDSIIGSSVNRSKLIGESYFLTGITQVQETNKDYNLAKAALYTALSESSTDDFKAYFSDAYERSFPKKQDLLAGVSKSLTEATDSTTAFVRYFGDSIQILNKAIGNIADAADYFAGGGKLFGGCKKEIEHLELGATDIDTTEECADPYIATVIAVYGIYGIVIQSVNVAVVSYDKTCLAF